MGQFLTPMPIAQFMASQLQCATRTVHILDAGAGVGTLFAELCQRKRRPVRIPVTAYEIVKMALMHFA